MKKRKYCYNVREDEISEKIFEEVFIRTIWRDKLSSKSLTKAIKEIRESCIEHLDDRLDDIKAYYKWSNQYKKENKIYEKRK
jgi:hypothetical protein